MTLFLREDDKQPAGATLIIHGGAGNIDFVRTASIEHYDDYRELRDESGLGYFTVSVFATVNGVEKDEIVSRLVHGSYGTATAGAVGSSFKLIPTFEDDLSLPPDISWLQQVHFDICLPDPPDERLLYADPTSDEGLADACSAFLTPHLEQLLNLFTRQPKA